MNNPLRSRHYESLWNFIEVSWLVLVTFVVIFSLTTEPSMSIDTLRTLAAIASCFMLMNGYNWLRLFDSTTFYIMLLGETVKDISAFMGLFGLGLFMFGVPMTLLSNNSMVSIDEETGIEVESYIVEHLFDFWGYNLLIGQYLLVLGDFATN